MPKQKPAISRAAFDREAKRLLADGTLQGLQTYAVECFVPKAKHRQEDLWQALALAVTRAAEEWWNNSQSRGSCYNKVEKAAAAVARNWRGRGGAAADLTWRGGYDSHTRKFSSQQHDHAAEIRLRAEFGDASDDEPDAGLPEEAPPEDAPAKPTLATDRERMEQGKAQAKTAGKSAELTSHDGAHADDERLSPRDDGETACGIDGATRGLHTGALVPSARWIAEQLALAGESDADQAWFVSVGLLGFEAWVSKNGDRKRARAAHEDRHKGIRRRVRDRSKAILDTQGDIELQTAWLAVMNPRHEHPASPGSGKGREAVGGVISAAWSGAPPSKAKGIHFGPVTVYRDYWQMVTVGGHTWADHQNNLREWQHRFTGPALSLLDTVGPGVKLKPTRDAANIWDGPMFIFPTVSLLDLIKV